MGTGGIPFPSRRPSSRTGRSRRGEAQRRTHVLELLPEVVRLTFRRIGRYRVVVLTARTEDRRLWFLRRFFHHRSGRAGGRRGDHFIAFGFVTGAVTAGVDGDEVGRFNEWLLDQINPASNHGDSAKEEHCPDPIELAC